MITFLANNWYWLLFIGAMVFMHAGHGGHGGHGGGAGGHGGTAGGHCGGMTHQDGHPQDVTHDTTYGTPAGGNPPPGSVPPR